MDGEFVMDLQDVFASVESADVMSLSFLTFRKALIIDTRSNGAEGPLVSILPMVASPQERVRSLRRLRPRFPRLRDLTVIPWPRYVDSLVSLGVWDRIVERFVVSGDDVAVAACEEALDELRRLEKAELAAVVSGESYHTIWASGE